MIFQQLFWWIRLFDVAIESSTGDPKSRAQFWNRMLFGGKELTSQHYFGIGLQLAGTAPDRGRTKILTKMVSIQMGYAVAE